MKRNLFYAAALAAVLISSCDSDDEPINVPINPPIEEPIPSVGTVVLNEVEYLGNRVEIYNNSNASVDITNYWLCLGPGRYSRIGALEIEGNLVLGAGELAVVSYNMPTESGGLGLYRTGGGFGNPDNIVDFVQWGEAGSPRENVAVSAGIWTEGDFVPVSGIDTYSIEYDGEGDAASDWTEASNSSLGLANGTGVASAMTTFDVKITNVTNYLNAHVFNTPVGATSPGPLNANGLQYQITFKAVPGTKFTPVTMMGNSNDWFLAPTDLGGISLWDESGNALNNVDIASQLSLYDAGTEADNNPANFPPAGANVGPADANSAVRILSGRGNGDIYMTAILNYAPAAAANEAGTFTFTITATNAPDPTLPASSNNGFVITPGIVVLHAQPEPLFTLGQPDRGVGLEGIAEDGQPGVLYNWFKETGSTGAPLRLSSSLSVFSPGLVYAFNSERDPLVLQGSINPANNGLEELAEDGNNAVAVDYLDGLNIPVAASNETTNQGPGGELNFSLNVPQGQGYKLGFTTMLVETNDWFISYNNAGFPLWDENGVAVSGTGASTKSYLYDAGTEVDEAVGFGIYQAPRQSAVNVGPADANNIVRRVGSIDDVQFGKGSIVSPAGVVYVRDPRGGYNVFRIEVTPR